MRAKFYRFVVLALILSLTLGTGVGQASPQSQETAPPPILLRVGTLVPDLNVFPSLPEGLTIPGYAPDQLGYYIVQFQGPVQQAWKDQVTATGAELLEYLPDFAFKVRMTPAQASQVQSLDAVKWVGIFQPGYKLSPTLVRDGVRLYTVRIERGVDPSPIVDAIAQRVSLLVDGTGRKIVVAANEAQLQAVAQLLDVAWIENFVLPQKHNEYGGGVIMGANTAHANGYDGSTQIVAVADTGLGDGTPQGAHPDIPASRIVAIYNWPGQPDSCFASIDDDGPQDVDSGHGTHVSVSVLGDGDANGIGLGVAPAAKLVFQATENWANTSFFCKVFAGADDGYYLTGLPDDLNDLFQQAYDDGARIHSNSWGAAVDGEYNSNSAEADQFVWNNPDMTITFSAGNDGEDANNDGVVDEDSTGAPATAKNVITVGASENDRADEWPCDTSLTYTSHDAYQDGETCSSMGGKNILGTAGQRWGFTTEPLNSDVTAGNPEQMAPFSSRGPTDDGRIKPDVVAPGTWILSGYSDLYQEGYDGDPVNPKNNSYQWDGWGMPFNKYYKYMGGTSMSNPLAAGGAAVIRDFYQKAYSHSASAALVKATMINSAVDLLDENNDGVNDNAYPIPNVHEGWGRVNLANATDGSHVYVDDANGLNTGDSSSFQYSVASSGSPFKVTLVWSDYPSTESASKNLVNDLDLVVTSPSGAVYKGNNFSGGWSVTGGNEDRTNNVENVYVQSAEAGTWTVEITGFNVPNGPQPFALVVDGDFGNAPTPTPTNTPAPPTATPTNTPVPPTATPTNTPVPPTATPTNTPAPPTATPTDTPVPPTATPTNTPGATATPTNTPVPPTATPTNTPAPPTATPTDTPVPPTATPTNTPVPPTPTPTPGASSMHVGDLDGVSTNLTWFWSADVTITVHDAGENPVANATVDGSWSSGFGGTTSCTTDSSGQCTVTRDIIFNRVKNVTFTVDNVSHASLTYQSADNHDPDGDSDGTSITVSR